MKRWKKVRDLNLASRSCKLWCRRIGESATQADRPLLPDHINMLQISSLLIPQSGFCTRWTCYASEIVSCRHTADSNLSLHFSVCIQRDPGLRQRNLCQPHSTPDYSTAHHVLNNFRRLYNTDLAHTLRLINHGQQLSSNGHALVPTELNDSSSKCQQ